MPWDAKQPLLAGYTQKVAAVMMRLAAQLNYRVAAAELKHQGIQVSHTTLHQKVQTWSEGEKVSDYVDEVSVGEGERWFVSCDGWQPNSPDGYKEVKVGSLGKDYPHQHAPSVLKICSSSLRYVASRSPAEAFGSQVAALSTEKHAHRMRYETLKKKVYQIGSGVIESACKHVVAERCKQAGMRWSQPGINATLFWRCLLKNQSFDKYWRTQQLQVAA